MRSVRVNTLKCTKEKIIQRFKCKPVDWYDNALLVEHEGSLASTREHQLGYFYIQTLSSMMPALSLGPQPGDTVLDMCAAPGSKTTQIAQMMKNEGIVIANDVEGGRIEALKANLQRCGVLNTIVTKMDGKQFEKTELKFDKVLLDAPCSGSGITKADMHVTEAKVKHFAAVQKELILAAYSCLKDCGTMVYSTCSVLEEENDDVVNFLLNRTDTRLLDRKIIAKTNDMEGFFVATIKRCADC